MLNIFCLVYLFSVIISVTPNPIAQLIQSCPLCQPTYNNPTSLPVVVQPSNYNPCPQLATAQTAPQGSFGDTLNQIILNRILTNPSLQKIIDPNTKLYNQNGEEIQRQVSSKSVPNVINNYFIVPPEFFNQNETTKDDVVTADIIRPRRTKSKRRPTIVELESDEDEDVIIVTKKESSKRRKQKEPMNQIVERKRKRIKAVENKDEDNYLGGTSKREKENRARRHKTENKRIDIVATPSTKESDEDETKIASPAKIKQKEPKRHRSESQTSEEELEKTAGSSQRKINRDAVSKEKEIEPDIPEDKKLKKNRRKKSGKTTEETFFSNIELPTDDASSGLKENRSTRDSKKNAAKKESAQTLSSIPNDFQNFFPYLPMGNIYNTNTNYPYNFDQYYQYLDPFRDSNANRDKKRLSQNRKTDDENSKHKHTIEIKLKPKKKESTTENPIIDKSEDLNNTNSAEFESTTESIELEIVTDIPMEIPHAVSPTNKNEFSSTESYETFSKLEDLQEHISPVLGEEDVVPTMHTNGIINEYYPVFNDDVYFNPYVENLKSLDDDDRYIYETNNEQYNRSRRKYDKYEDYMTKKENIDLKTRKMNPHINKYDHNDYNEFIRPSQEIEIIKVPPKNTRVKSENVETVFAGSKVAKYGGPSEETAENTSYSGQTSDEAYEPIIHVVGKSIERPEDYY